MAVVIVFWPMRVFSASSAALSAAEAIQHTVVEFVTKQSWQVGGGGTGFDSSDVEAVRTACGNTIEFRVYDTQTKYGKPRPIRRCSKCAASSKDAVELIGVSGGGWNGARAHLEGTAQGSLLS